MHSHRGPVKVVMKLKIATARVMSGLFFTKNFILRIGLFMRCTMDPFLQAIKLTILMAKD